MNHLIRRLAFRVLPELVLHNIRKIHYLRVLRSASDSSEEEMGIVGHLVRPGDHVVDIGANIGVYTKSLSRMVGDSGRVYSIEPVPPTFDILRWNVRKLHLPNVELFGCAISDGSRIVTMEIPRGATGEENFYEARIVSRPGDGSLRLATVESRTIDSLFASRGIRIGFIKCDVEGHELMCIRGAGTVIRDSRPAWLIEISGSPDHPGSESYELFGRLADSGYKAYWSDGGCVRQRHAGDRSVNYFFLMPEHLDMLREGGTLVQAV